MTEAYLSGIHYALGSQIRSLEEAAAMGLVHSPVDALSDAGFRCHHTGEPGTSAYDLAVRCTAPLADRLPEVDAIVYSTCLPGNANVGDGSEFERNGDVKHLMVFPASRLQARFGMGRAQVFGLTQQACTGALGGLRLARMLMRDDAAIRSVLCVTADRFPEGAHYEQAYNLISDGAAACLVGAEPTGFRILAGHGITNGALVDADDDQTVGAFFNYAHRVIHETCARAGLSLGELDWIVAQNTHRKAWRVLSRLLPFPEERIAHPSLGTVGHVISADCLINLSQLDEAGAIEPGQRVLLFMAGYGLNWQCLIVEKED